MKDEGEENPLNLIFLKNSEEETTEEFEDIQKIPEFFIYMTNPQIEQEKKISIIKQLQKKFNVNKYLMEYFSFYENISIYIYLFDIFLLPETTGELKLALIDFISEIRCNIETGKEIYQYIFQKLSIIYRAEENFNFEPNEVYNLLLLLNAILGSTENCTKPRNYFSCIGNGQFILDCNKQITMGNAFSILMNFKIGISDILENDDKNKRISNLVNINFSNNTNISIDLKYPKSLIIKDLDQDFVKNLPINEYIFLFVTFIPIPQFNSIKIILYSHDINGEITSNEFEIYRKNSVKPSDSIVSIEFFKKFYGEVTSIVMFSQSEEGNNGILNKNFIEEISKFKGGLWKKKNTENFLKILKKYTSIEPEEKKESKTSKKNVSHEEKKGLIFDDLISIFTPMNCYNAKTIEDYFSRNQLIFNGDIRNHKYICYQKKLDLVCSLQNFLPIAEMFLIHQQLLTEDNLELFLNIINNLIKDRKENMKKIKNNKFFKILCLFIEKYPNNFFTQKILDIFFEIGKNIFASIEKNFESLVANYFNHILLNEKILSKFDENLQLNFWNTMYKFCESDKSQIEILINMNRLCLILRFYDRNKYLEMCCEEHYSVFKEEFIGSKKIMNPPMYKKLSYLKDIMDLIMLQQEPKNVVSLFKLLTLDLSPCLTRFILNIFINAFENDSQKYKDWTSQLIKELFKSNVQVIITNTFMHTLPEIRIVIIKFIYIIYQKLKRQNEIKLFKKIENMIKTCLLPQKMFYENVSYYIEENTNNNNNNNNSHERKATLNLSNITNKNELNKRTSSEVNFYNFYDKNSINNLCEYDERDFENNIIKEEEEEINTNKIEKNENNEKNNKQIINEEVLVIKDEIYSEYIDALFCIFLDWICDKEICLNSEVETDINITIKNINGLELLSALNSDIKDIDFTKKFLNIINYMIMTKGNAYLIISNNNIMNYLLDLSFNYYLIQNSTETKDNNESNDNNTFYELTKLSILTVFKNSLLFIEEQNYNDIFPLERLEIFFIWGTRLLNKDENLQTKEILFEFLSDIFLSLLNDYRDLYNNNLENMYLKFKVNSPEDFYIKNYLIMITKFYQFLYLFKLDSVIVTNGLSFVTSFSPKIDLPHIYLSSMRIGCNTGKKVEDYWIDFKLFNDFYSRVKHLWRMGKLFKGHNMKKIKKENKYDYILNNIILVKEKKNVYQNELEFFFYQELKENEENIISPMKILIINLMSILSIANNSKNEEDMLYWLKEFKYFIKFIIITSSNLTKINQVEIYNNLQQKCAVVLSLGLCFMKNMVDTATICKDKFKKYFSKIFNFCINIVYYQYNYNDNHKLGKKVFSFAAKAARNDLSGCAVFLLFTDYAKDNDGIALLTPLNRNIYINQKEKILNLINSKDWNEFLFKNPILKSEINKSYFGLNLYEKIVVKRFFSAKELDDEKDTSYTKTILELLPNYEQELLKHSNNSFEKNLKVKNKYKKFKKQCFSWRGLWSDWKIFFGEHGPNVKLKLANHYTNNFMRPILVPILDIKYYLPDFSHFDTNKLFKNEDEKIFQLNVDIDKILKSNEKSQSLIKNIKQNFEQELNTTENYLRKIYTKSIPYLAIKLHKISNKLDFGKEEEFTFLRKDSKSNHKSKKNYFLCCIVKTSHHIKGVCFIDDDQLNFKVFFNQKTGTAMRGIKQCFTDKDDDYDQERKTCFGSYFVCHPKDKDLYKISIHYKDIKWIFRRRYYYKNSGLEIFTITNKTFYLNFKYEEDREYVLLKLGQKLKHLIQIIDDLKDNKDNFGNVIGYENSLVVVKKNKKKISLKKDKKIKLSKKIKDWKKWKITNFEFLMWLNIFSNRSYNDISQYPVFPWILSSYSDPLQIEQNKDEENIIDYSYRDLTKPMGMLELNPESIKRKELFMETYDTLKNENAEAEENEASITPYIFGSNYSNPMYVCNYLMRIFPFTHISIELQGSNFDQPERLFLSVVNSFNNSTTQKTDVRELIPEFFYLPEMFININRLNLGNLEEGQEVNDAITPCNNNPYDFIMVMRGVLENDKLSEKINSWIDLIFGSKSKGKEAEIANNIFTASSYQEDIDLKNNKNKESLLRLVEFGLIPNQIMTKDCLKREKKEDILKEKEITDQNCNLKVEKTEKTEKSKLHIITSILDGDKGKVNKINKNNIGVSILKIGLFSEDRINVLFNSDNYTEIKITKSLDKKTYADETIKTIEFNQIGNRMFKYQNPREYNDKICVHSDKGKTIIMGGYYDGKVIIMYTEPEIKINELIPFDEDIPICAITLSQDEDYLFIGNMNGNIKIYKKKEKSEGKIYEWNSVNKIIDQMTEISHIYCNNELNIWASASIDGYINIYSFPLCKLFRCIKVPTKNCRYTFLSSSPLPSIIAICNEKAESEIFVYSINGKFLYNQKEQNSILSPNIIKDLNSNDYLVYICNSTICIRTIPNLIIQVLIEDLPGIYTIFTNDDKTTLYATNRNGNDIYIIKDESKN